VIIGEGALECCYNITSLTLGNTVASIGDEALLSSWCKSVTNLATTPQKIKKRTFEIYGTLHVLPGCKAAYEAADYWKEFLVVEDAIDTQSGTPQVAGVKADNDVKDGK
jgi:hypothetical protein